MVMYWCFCCFNYSNVEISQFSAFIIGDKCDFINPFLEKFFDKVLDDHDTCFEVQAHLESVFWVLFEAVIMYWFYGGYENL